MTRVVFVPVRPTKCDSPVHQIRERTFKVVVDPEMRLKLRRALVELIDYHDEALAEHFAEGKLALESYKEYIELFARSLKETMDSREGVSYLLRSVGFEVGAHEINMNPELRWKKGPRPFGPSLL